MVVWLWHIYKNLNIGRSHCVGGFLGLLLKSEIEVSNPSDAYGVAVEDSSTFLHISRRVICRYQVPSSYTRIFLKIFHEYGKHLAFISFVIWQPLSIRIFWWLSYKLKDFFHSVEHPIDLFSFQHFPILQRKNVFKPKRGNGSCIRRHEKWRSWKSAPLQKSKGSQQLPNQMVLKWNKILE